MTRRNQLDFSDVPPLQEQDHIPAKMTQNNGSRIALTPYKDNIEPRGRPHVVDSGCKPRFILKENLSKRKKSLLYKKADSSRERTGSFIAEYGVAEDVREKVSKVWRLLQ